MSLLAVRESGPLAARQVDTYLLAQGAAFDLSGDIALNTAHREIVAGNPHGTSKADIGLGNVTDDSQLKRAAGDFNTFGTAALSLTDIILLESSGGAFGKIKATLQTLKGLIGGGGINYDSPIAVDTSQTITPNDGDYFTSTALRVDLTGTAGEVFEPAESGETSRRIWGRGGGAALITITIDTSLLGIGEIFAIELDNGESRVLRLNSVGDLVKIDGVVTPLICEMHRNTLAPVPVPDSTGTFLDLDVTDLDNSGQMADDTVNKRIDIIRDGVYDIHATLFWGSTGSSHNFDHETEVRLIGTTTHLQIKGYIHAAQNFGLGLYYSPVPVTLTDSDYLGLWGAHFTVGGSENLDLYGPTSAHRAYVKELNPW